MSLQKHIIFTLAMCSLASGILHADEEMPEVPDCGLLGFEVTLGAGGCSGENIQPPSEYGVFLNRTVLSGTANIQYSYSKLFIVVGFYGPYEYSVNIAEVGEHNEGDLIIRKDSKLKFGNYGIYAAWCLNEPYGLDIKPMVGYRWYYLSSDIRATEIATGDSISIKGENKAGGLCLGAIGQLPIWCHWKEGKLKHQLSIRSHYSYHFSKLGIGDFGLRPTFSIYLKEPKDRRVHFFIEYTGNRGIGTDRRYLLVGFSIDATPGAFFTNK